MDGQASSTKCSLSYYIILRPAGTPRPTCTVDDPYSEIAGIIHTLRTSALLTNSGSQLAPWRAHRNAWAKMDGIASQIVKESKANAKLEGPDAERDLVSVLVKANVSQSAGEPTSLRWRLYHVSPD
jgi:hypothetical protein